MISGDPANISGSAPDNIGDRAQIALSDHLRLETIFDAMGVPDHTDHGPSHRKYSAVIVLRKRILLGWATIPDDHACDARDQHVMRTHILRDGFAVGGPSPAIFA